MYIWLYIQIPVNHDVGKDGSLSIHQPQAMGMPLRHYLGTLAPWWKCNKSRTLVLDVLVTLPKTNIVPESPQKWWFPRGISEIPGIDFQGIPVKKSGRLHLDYVVFIEF